MTGHNWAHMNDLRLLADVGGTNSRVGMADANGLLPDTVRAIPNARFSGLERLLAAYLDHMGDPAPAMLCAGVAGPVRGAVSQLTNLDWRIEASNLCQATGARRVALINDLQAQGYALGDLDPDMVETLSAGAADPAQSATRLVMGMGTGSNVAVAHAVNGNLFVPPCEAGHSGLPFINGALTQVMAQLSAEQPHLPIEAFLSGPGLARLHWGLCGQSILPANILSQSKQGLPEASSTMHIFAQLLGSVMGNFALMHLPMGGIYLIGGFARAVAPYLTDHGFRAAFDAKGPYADIMRDISVHLIRDDNTALLGCARFLRQTHG